MKFLSLFSGGGLGDYGLELAGMEVVGQIEIDDYCQKILKLRWPDIPKWTNIKNVTGKEILERVGTVDLISGGFPCQDISVANSRGKGIDGDKSGLWKEMFRIICEIRPKFVLVENVPALLHRGLGANHRRKRIWILAYPISNGLSKRNSDRCEIVNEGDNTSANRKQKQNSSYTGQVCEDVAHTNGKRLEKQKLQSRLRIKQSETIRNNWKTEPNVGRVVNGTPNRVDRLKLLGNGQVVQVVEWIGKRIMEVKNQHKSRPHG